MVHFGWESKKGNICCLDIQLVLWSSCFSVSCFFKIPIFPISFSSAKWRKISLESLMIELYLYLKIYLDYFPGRLKYTDLGKSIHLTFWAPVPKVAEVIPKYLYSLLLHRFIYKTILGFMISSNTSPVISKYVHKNLC